MTKKKAYAVAKGINLCGKLSGHVPRFASPGSVWLIGWFGKRTNSFVPFSITLVNSAFPVQPWTKSGVCVDSGQILTCDRMTCVSP